MENGFKQFFHRHLRPLTHNRFQFEMLIGIGFPMTDQGGGNGIHRTPFPVGIALNSAPWFISKVQQ
ncbi:MAG: hypothetical protein QNK37_32915 [Acidobacteriota bacterium]|nr:hypothetical protein [Acidobacteriota bacterium]